MSEAFENHSYARLVYREGYRYAYLGEVIQPVLYGVQGALRQYYGAREGLPLHRPSITSLLPSLAECMAHLPVPCQGARYPMIEGHILLPLMGVL